MLSCNFNLPLHVRKVFTHIILGKTRLPCFSRVLVDSISLPRIPYHNLHKKISKKQGVVINFVFEKQIEIETFLLTT